MIMKERVFKTLKEVLSTLLEWEEYCTLILQHLHMLNKMKM